MNKKSPIVLASRSPRRKQLLEWAEIDFDILVKDTDEHYPRELAVEEVPVYIATKKAEAVIASPEFTRYVPGNTVLAADTIVVLGKRVIGKPADRAEAIETLTLLSGKTHRVITGVVIVHGGQTISFSDITEVAFHEITNAQIEYYVDHYEPYDKAGSYAIQEWIGVTGIRSIQGDFYNVMGLPVSRVVKILDTL